MVTGIVPGNTFDGANSQNLGKRQKTWVKMNSCKYFQRQDNQYDCKKVLRALLQTLTQNASAQLLRKYSNLHAQNLQRERQGHSREEVGQHG